MIDTECKWCDKTLVLFTNSGKYIPENQPPRNYCPACGKDLRRVLSELDIKILKDYMETGLSPEEVIKLRDIFYESKEVIEVSEEEKKIRVFYRCPSCGKEVWGHRCEECGQRLFYKDEKEG